MLTTFSSIAPYLKINQKRVTIDNFYFKIHYRFTFIILIVATILVTSRQYVGEHIKCISGSIPENVVNTFCFITTTFTVIRHFNESALESGAIFQPGIGPYLFQEEPIKRHAYYQWVPFVLFGQALCFLVPHFLWKGWEGGRLKQLVFGLKMAGLSKYIKNQNLKIGKLKSLSCEEAESRVLNIGREVADRVDLNRRWGINLVVAECLNLLNILIQMWWTNKFLAGQFYSLGWKVLSQKWDTRSDVLDVVFPKVTKCHFHKFGPSGSLQVHDTLCVMALNIINEKIYIILWFWFWFVSVISFVAVFWRILTMFVYKNKKFSAMAFTQAKPGGGIDRDKLHRVIVRGTFSDWMFLYYVATNLSEFLFKKVIHHLDEEFSPNVPLDKTSSQNEANEAQDDLVYPNLLDVVDSPLLPKGEEKETTKID